MKNYRLYLLATVSIVVIGCSGCGGNQAITIKNIFISSEPIKTVYKVGEYFDSTGMTVSANMSDGSITNILNYTYTPTTALTKNDYQITVSYQTFSVTQSITVNGTDPEPPVPGDYYSSITSNMSGTELLNALNKLNKSKRTRTVGYKAMLNNPSQGFYVTDPGSSASTITTFYSGKNNNGTSGLNREHVWPSSRGGSSVENDIHMPRPTLSKENGSRGNSFYVEGKCKPSGGWDPAMEDFGLETYRGDSARIIFYCAIADTNLTIVDKEDDNNNNKTMGKLSDLLKWNLKYSVLERENIRNAGAEKLQGNRNPFIDHPEYACRIWGLTNSTTKSICGL